MRPIARLGTELLVSGVGQVVIGLLGLLAGLLLIDEPVRALVAFAVAFVALAAVSCVHVALDAGRTPGRRRPGRAVEPSSQTVRRTAVALALALVVTGIAAAIGGGLAAVLGGLVAGVGAVDLVNRAWVLGRERETGLALYRELGRSPFSSGRRPLYTRPRNDITLAT